MVGRQRPWGSSWLPRRCGDAGELLLRQQILLATDIHFEVGNTSWPFKELKVLGNRVAEEDAFLKVLRDLEMTGRAAESPLLPISAPQLRSLVLQIVFERLRQRQGADVPQALAAQGQADGSPAQVHQRQGLSCNRREVG